MDMMNEPEAMHDQPMDKELSATLPKKLLQGKDFKVGDEVVLKIENIGGDTITVSYAPEKPEEDHMMSDEEMQKMDPKEAASMPLDKLEKSLPVADRGY